MKPSMSTKTRFSITSILLQPALKSLQLNTYRGWNILQFYSKETAVFGPRSDVDAGFLGFLAPVIFQPAYFHLTNRRCFQVGTNTDRSILVFLYQNHR